MSIKGIKNLFMTLFTQFGKSKYHTFLLIVSVQISKVEDTLYFHIFDTLSLKGQNKPKFGGIIQFSTNYELSKLERTLSSVKSVKNLSQFGFSILVIYVIRINYIVPEQVSFLWRSIVSGVLWPFTWKVQKVQSLERFWMVDKKI